MDFFGCPSPIDLLIIFPVGSSPTPKIVVKSTRLPYRTHRETTKVPQLGISLAIY